MAKSLVEQFSMAKMILIYLGDRFGTIVALSESGNIDDTIGAISSV